MTRRTRFEWALLCALLLTGFWALLSGGAGLWPYGVSMAAFAAGLGAALAPGRVRAVRPAAALWFSVVFLWVSLRGGADVALRAFDPSTRLTPAWHDVPLELEGDAPRALLAITISLTPGTLCADVLPGHLRIHTLSPEMIHGVPRLVRLIGRMFRDPGLGAPA